MATAAANVAPGAHRTGTGSPRIGPANLVTPLVIAGIWTVGSFVLAVGVRVKLRAVDGIVARRPARRPQRKEGLPRPAKPISTWVFSSRAGQARGARRVRACTRLRVQRLVQAVIAMHAGKG